MKYTFASLAEDQKNSIYGHYCRIIEYEREKRFDRWQGPDVPSTVDCDPTGIFLKYWPPPMFEQKCAKMRKRRKEKQLKENFDPMNFRQEMVWKGKQIGQITFWHHNPPPVHLSPRHPRHPCHPCQCHLCQDPNSNPQTFLDQLVLVQKEENILGDILWKEDYFFVIQLSALVYPLCQLPKLAVHSWERKPFLDFIFVPKLERRSFYTEH